MIGDAWLALWRKNRWVRGAAFLAGNVVAAFIIFDLVITPVSALFAERDASIADKRALLVRLQGIAAQEARVQEAARETDPQRKRGDFRAGPNDGVITADLQTRLKGMAERSGARLRSIQGLPPKGDAELRYVGSRLEILGPIQAIHRTIHA